MGKHTPAFVSIVRVILSSFAPLIPSFLSIVSHNVRGTTEAVPKFGPEVDPRDLRSSSQCVTSCRAEINQYLYLEWSRRQPVYLLRQQ